MYLDLSLTLKLQFSFCVFTASIIDLLNVEFIKGCLDLSFKFWILIVFVQMGQELLLLSAVEVPGGHKVF